MDITQPVTLELVKANLGKVWTSPSWLSMRGMCYHDNRPLYDFLEAVVKVMVENNLENLHEGAINEAD
jgi:hypothetical protein